MSYVYHLKPNNMHGSELIPLNEMDKTSEIYQEYIKKYQGREHIMDATIPILNCRWNDVVHFSSINPEICYRHLKGFDPEIGPPTRKYLKIPIKDLINAGLPGVIFDRSPTREKGNYDISLEEVEQLTIDSYKETLEIPKTTKTYWEEVKKEGSKRYLLFAFIPHVFLKGSFEITDYSPIEVKP